MDFEQLPHAELLAAYLDGEATPDERALVERLLAEQPEYQQLAAELSSLSGTLAALPRRPLGTDLAPAVLAEIEARRKAAAPPLALHLPAASLGGSSSDVGSSTNGKTTDSDWFERLPLATAPPRMNRYRLAVVLAVASAAAALMLLVSVDRVRSRNATMSEVSGLQRLPEPAPMSGAASEDFTHPAFTSSFNLADGEAENRSKESSESAPVSPWGDQPAEAKFQAGSRDKSDGAGTDGVTLSLGADGGSRDDVRKAGLPGPGGIGAKALGGAPGGGVPTPRSPAAGVGLGSQNRPPREAPRGVRAPQAGLPPQSLPPRGPQAATSTAPRPVDMESGAPVSLGAPNGALRALQENAERQLKRYSDVAGDKVLVVELVVTPQAVQSGELKALFQRQGITFAAPPVASEIPANAKRVDRFGSVPPPSSNGVAGRESPNPNRGGEKAAGEPSKGTASKDPGTSDAKGDAAPEVAPSSVTAGPLVAKPEKAKVSSASPPASEPANASASAAAVPTGAPNYDLAAPRAEGELQRGLGVLVEAEADQLEALLGEVLEQEAYFDVAWVRPAIPAPGAAAGAAASEASVETDESVAEYHRLWHFFAGSSLRDEDLKRSRKSPAPANAPARGGADREASQSGGSAMEGLPAGGLAGTNEQESAPTVAGQPAGPHTFGRSGSVGADGDGDATARRASVGVASMVEVASDFDGLNFYFTEPAVRLAERTHFGADLADRDGEIPSAARPEAEGFGWRHYRFSAHVAPPTAVLPMQVLTPVAEGESVGAPDAAPLAPVTPSAAALGKANEAPVPQVEAGSTGRETNRMMTLEPRPVRQVENTPAPTDESAPTDGSEQRDNRAASGRAKPAARAEKSMPPPPAPAAPSASPAKPSAIPAPAPAEMPADQPAVESAGSGSAVPAPGMSRADDGATNAASPEDLRRQAKKQSPGEPSIPADNAASESLAAEAGSSGTAPVLNAQTNRQRVLFVLKLAAPPPVPAADAATPAAAAAPAPK